MRFTLSVVLLGLSVVAAAACGSSVVSNSSGAATGAGGTGGEASSVTSVASASAGNGAGSVVTTTTVSTTGVSTTTASVAASSSSTGPWTMEATFPSAPQVQYFGGPVLSSPVIYGVFFSSDDPTITGPLQDFTTNIGGTDYWKAATSEYGVGPAIGKIITVTDTPAKNLTDAQIQTWLTGKFGTDPGFPATPGPNDVYIIYYPAGITVTLQGMQSCYTFGGYHDNAPYKGGDVTYAVVPRCQGMGGLLVNATESASHELIEAATDPLPMGNSAYQIVDYADIYWAIALGGGEIGDMCAQQPQMFTTFPGFNYVVQRVWSNQAAAAGHDPCQPEPAGEVYYNAAPVFSGTVDYVIQGQTVPVRGVKIGVGQTASIPVDYYSDGPMSAWPAQAYDYSSEFMGGSPLLAVTLTPPTGQNGTKGTLEITVKQAGANNQELFFIASSTDNGQTVNWSFGVVTN